MRTCPKCGGLTFEFNPHNTMWRCLVQSCGFSRWDDGLSTEERTEMDRPPTTSGEARRYLTRASGAHPQAKPGEALIGIGYALIAQAEALERIADVLVTEQMDKRFHPIDNQRT